VQTIRTCIGVVGALALLLLLFHAPWQVRREAPWRAPTSYRVIRTVRASVFGHGPSLVSGYGLEVPPGARVISNPSTETSKEQDYQHALPVSAVILTGELALEAGIIISATAFLLLAVPYPRK
jgi:hypothetical protein